jgi:hypothetical protein
MKLFLLHFVFYTITSIVLTQNIDNKSLNHMNVKKDSLIQLANEILELKYPSFKFNVSEYDITAWGNSKTTVVKYKRIIRFIPLDKKNNNLCYDFEVDLINKSIYPFDTWGIDMFYIPTSEEQAKIDFVIKAFGLPHKGFSNSIEEDADVYRINLDNEYSYGRYVIDKITGKECDGAIQGSYEPMPEDNSRHRFADPLVEIRD